MDLRPIEKKQARKHVFGNNCTPIHLLKNVYEILDGFLLQTRQKMPPASLFLRASMLGTIDGFLSVMLCYSKYGATGIKGTRRTPSVVLSTWQLSYYVDTCGV